jgi:guanine nucleotide-binding protein G(i) subunit alpha
MLESLVLFDSVITSRWFLRTSVILLLNKINVFQNTLSKVCFTPPLVGQADHHHLEQVPLERYFPEYTGGSDINQAAKYILRRFIRANRARLPVYGQYVVPPLVVLLSPLTL